MNQGRGERKRKRRKSSGRRERRSTEQFISGSQTFPVALHSVTPKGVQAQSLSLCPGLKSGRHPLSVLGFALRHPHRQVDIVLYGRRELYTLYVMLSRRFLLSTYCTQGPVPSSENTEEVCPCTEGCVSERGGKKERRRKGNKEKGGKAVSPRTGKSERPACEVTLNSWVVCTFQQG